MRSDVFFTQYPSEDVVREVAVLHYKASTTTWAELIAGTATPYANLSDLVDSISNNASGVEFSVRFQNQMFGVGQPKYGDLIQVLLDGVVLFNGQVDGLTGYREEHGVRTFGVSVKTRDASPLWRQTKWATDVYPVGTELGKIVEDTLKAIGLGAAEMPAQLQTGLHTVHGDTQLADLPVWDMLTNILQAGGQEPMINALGKFALISRDVTRTHDIALSNEQVLNITGDRVRTPVTSLVLKWLNPELAKTNSQSQVLAKDSITAGFFKLKQERKLYWSEDRRQRAQNTFMKIIASVNDGLLPVGDEEYEQKDEFHGQITVTTSAWVPTLATATMAAMIAASWKGDEVTSAPGVTIPIGRYWEAVGQVAYFLIIMSLGTGNYEIWGEPYDYVHETNTTEAYDAGQPGWVRLEEEISSDFITNEEHAQAVAVRELLYRSLSAHSWNVDIIDHPAIERGDILQLPDGSRLYVNDFSRDLAHGAPAVLSVKGFRV